MRHFLISESNRYKDLTTLFRSVRKIGSIPLWGDFLSHWQFITSFLTLAAKLVHWTYIFACPKSVSIVKTESSFSTDYLQTVPLPFLESVFSSLKTLIILFFAYTSRCVYTFTLSCFSFLKIYAYTLKTLIIMFPLFQTDLLSSNS